MSAIAHGWEPTGSAAGIPVKVAKEFHAADKGKKYGKGGKRDSKFHGVRHSPAGIANNEGYTPSLEGHVKKKDGAHFATGHVHQPHVGDDTDAGHIGLAEHHRGHAMKHDHSPGGGKHEPMLKHVAEHRQRSAHTYHKAGHVRVGHLRMSGIPGAHRLGKR